MIFLLTVILGMMLLSEYHLNNKDIIAPSFLFTFGFLICSVIAASYTKKIQLGMHQNTFFVVVFGVAIFQLFSLYYERREPLLSGMLDIRQDRNLSLIIVQKGKILFFIGFEIITVLLSLRFVEELSGGDSFSKMLYAYRVMSMSVDTASQTVFPSYLSFFRLIIDAGSYLLAYIFANNSIVAKKVQLLPLVGFLLALISNGLTGGRGSIANQIISLLVIYFFLNSYYKKKIVINIKNLFLGLFLIFLSLFGFEKIGTLMGRSNEIVGFNYLVGYCGAELKNLDIFLQSGKYGRNTIWGSQTFVNIINWIGGKINPHKYIYSLDNPFNIVNGVGIGNVSTTFYAFIYDFGYWGIFPLTAFMGLISGKLFYYAKRFMNNSSPKTTTCNLYLVFYSYIASTLLTSFFSNKFYETVFSGAFIKSVFVIFGLYVFFCKIHFVVRRINMAVDS